MMDPLRFLEPRPIRAFLDEHHLAFAASARDFAAREIASRPPPESDGAARAGARALLSLLGGGGWLDSIREGDWRSACLAREALAAANPLADAVFALQGLATLPLLFTGPSPGSERWIDASIAGRAMGGRRKTARISNCCVHVDVVGPARAGEIEGSAVVDGSAVDRQSERDVHRGVESDQLHGNVPLIVILGDDEVEGAAVGAVKNGVWRDRAVHVDTFRAGLRDGGRDLRLVLVTEQAVLAAMRIDAGDRDARPLQAKAAEMRMADADGREYAFGRRASDSGFQRHMGRDVNCGQPLGRQQHEGGFCAGQRGEHARMAIIMMAGSVQRLLVDRRGDDAADLAAARHFHGTRNEAERRVAGAGVELAECWQRTIQLYMGDGDFALLPRCR